MTDKLFMTAHDVAEVLGISDGKAYQIIRTLNSELQKEGYIIVHGRVNTKYFKKKVLYEED